MLDQPFRMSVSDVYRTQTLGLAVSGRVEAGNVMVGDKLVVMPLGQETCTVKGTCWVGVCAPLYRC